MNKVGFEIWVFFLINIEELQKHENYIICNGLQDKILLTRNRKREKSLFFLWNYFNLLKTLVLVEKKNRIHYKGKLTKHTQLPLLFSFFFSFFFNLQYVYNI